MKKEIVIALAGNPNSGKSTIFNNLTGARQHVGNYPGVTVERKEGLTKHGDVEIRVVDLPGIYSLTAHSVEEVVARNFLIEEQPDVVVDIIDSANLERNLYLAVQLREMGVPLVLAFNMSDMARALGYEYDIPALSRFFETPIVQTVGHKGEGLKELLDVIVATASGQRAVSSKPAVEYGRDIEREIAEIESLISKETALTGKYGARWLAVKLLEGDRDMLERIPIPDIRQRVATSISRLEKILGEHMEVALAGRRYGFISGACQEAVRSTIEIRHRWSDRIDSVVTNRFLGLPIFLGLMYLVFFLTFTLGEPPMHWIEGLFGMLGRTVSGFWPKGSESALQSLLVDGIIGGVGRVVVFLPNILILFLAIALLEDSGYMARAAFVVDGLMHKIGLHGKSFIPMLIGFGCNVPAVMATRILESRKDRLTTMMVIPLMSCGARLPIYALFIPAFFPQPLRGPMLWSIYLIGIVLAVLTARLLRNTLFRGESDAFVMELPLYRIPTLTGLLIHAWEGGWLYLRKAGTIILCIALVMWAMTSYPKKAVFDRDYEAEAEQIVTAYLAGVKALNGKFAPLRESDLLVEAVQAELAMAAKQEKLREGEPGFAEAVREKDAVIAALGRSEHGEVLMELLAVRDEIRKARGDFSRAIKKGGVAESSPEYADLAQAREAALKRIEADHPDVYASVLRFLDEVETPYRERLVGLERARKAEELSYSIAGRIGKALEPVLEPMGFDWRIGTALIGAFAAKEVFVAQLGIVFSMGEVDAQSELLRKELRSHYSPLVAFCIMLYTLISMPCMATVVVTAKESGSWKWALLQLGGLTAMAYVLTVVVYQVGRLAGIGV